jgi:ribosomal protein S18 acetylase RimI-like enzyme
MNDAIKPATPHDAATAAQLLYDFNQEFHEPTPEPDELAKRIRELLAAGDTTIVLIGDPAFGLALLRFRLSLWGPGLEAYLAELYIAPARRGKGFGRKLLQAAMGTAREQGASYIDLGTSEDDVAARKLYESMGFSNTQGRLDGPINYFYEREL